MRIVKIKKCHFLYFCFIFRFECTDYDDENIVIIIKSIISARLITQELNKISRGTTKTLQSIRILF